jgi:hypothetical protein
MWEILNFELFLSLEIQLNFLNWFLEVLEGEIVG